MTPTDVMIDLETLGTTPGSVIVAIGAVAFDRNKVGGVAIFDVRIDPADAQRRGLTIDANTVMWWLAQSDDARSALKALGGPPILSLDDALVGLGEFVKGCGPDVCVWGNGADFDLTLLGAAYHTVGRATPWSHRKHRCLRTLKDVLPPEATAAAIADTDAACSAWFKPHVALLDARWQARLAVEIYARLREAQGDAENVGKLREKLGVPLGVIEQPEPPIKYPATAYGCWRPAWIDPGERIIRREMFFTRPKGACARVQEHAGGSVEAAWARTEEDVLPPGSGVCPEGTTFEQAKEIALAGIATLDAPK